MPFIERVSPQVDGSVQLVSAQSNWSTRSRGIAALPFVTRVTTRSYDDLDQRPRGGRLADRQPGAGRLVDWEILNRPNKGSTNGISHFAVEALTDLVYIELPEVGRRVKAGESFGEVESALAAETTLRERDIILEATVREQVRRIHAHPWTKDVPVHGLIYDVETGRLRDVG